MAGKSNSACLPTKPKLKERSLMTEREAARLEATFKTLANRTRLRLLHALVQAGELCVSDLAEILGMRHQAVSNQLQRLSDRGIVEARREGLQMYYRIVDPCVVLVLERGWCLTEDAAIQTSQKGEKERIAS